ncbi:hypothetical protein [Psychrobacillus sp. FSL H8-0510]|uniref:hypothetical protein n=1 Tax=Psychrobacillus sp. FSL H8-0510 TaxID=2921394 RepID=UPI0030FA081A
MLKMVIGNLMEVERGILVHQVNCQGVIETELGKKIREKYPMVYEKYNAVCVQAKGDISKLLGKIQCIGVESELYVVNLFGQDYYGTDKRYTDYKSFRDAFSKLIVFSSQKNLPLHIPDDIGCGIAGGEWYLIEKIIIDELAMQESLGVFVDCTIVSLADENACQACRVNRYTQLCDFGIGSGITTSIDFKELVTTCDRKLCKSCAIHLWSDCDVCPEHASIVNKKLAVQLKL